jgi:tRNA dimethylallyltransferase
MGPTASGKTGQAIRLAESLPLDIVSVDSAMVYRGMDIGTAKPDAETLSRAPHALVDIRDPEEAYSAGAFVRDAVSEIRRILDTGRVPLLVGGTMLYFRALIDGIAELPEADPAIRRALDEEGDDRGWPALHRELESVDPGAAGRIAPNDRQRIQRALEVYRATGRSLSEWQESAARPGADFNFLKIALLDPDRTGLHNRINRRFREMLDAGFIEEVEALRSRPGLSSDASSMRSVGYRQIWAYLDGACDLFAASERAQAATRQLAKRQITWLRTERAVNVLDPLDKRTPMAILKAVEGKLNE